jgi:nucleotide-binding universal stress UspA family protein
MLNIRQILFPVDLSERCTASAGHVARMAAHFRARVTMLHAVQFAPKWYSEIAVESYAAALDAKELMQECKAALDGYLRQPDELCHSHRILIEGDPAEVITEYARKEKPDLIMMPTHGYGPFRRFLLGSVTAKVLHDVECPVWTDVHRERSYAPQGCGMVLYAVDARQESVAPLRWAAEYAASLGAQLKLVHVIPPTVSSPELPEEAAFRRYLVDYASTRVEDLKRRAGTDAKLIIEVGKISATVREVALREGADLIVIGPGRIHEPLGGLRTHAYAIIREAPCPVVRV